MHLLKLRKQNAVPIWGDVLKVLAKHMPRPTFFPKLNVALILAVLTYLFVQSLVLIELIIRNHLGNVVTTFMEWEANATVESMVGYPEIHEVDIRDSREFLRQVIEDKKIGTKRALDCGCGIGRVAKHVLLPIFEKVDGFDGTRKFVDAYPAHVGRALEHKIGRLSCSTMQEFKAPAKEFYDLIWIQWLLMYSSDDDAAEFLSRIQRSLTPAGVIVLKENVADFDEDETDEAGWVARSMRTFKKIFSAAGLRMSFLQQQTDYPDYLYNLTFFVLEPPQNTVLF